MASCHLQGLRTTEEKTLYQVNPEKFLIMPRTLPHPFGLPVDAMSENQGFPESQYGVELPSGYANTQ